MEMDFIVDKETKTVLIAKEFAAELALVWDAYIKVELPDQWWAPKPFASRAKVLAFHVGCKYVTDQRSPDGRQS